jgi:hypothetical protein
MRGQSSSLKHGVVRSHQSLHVQIYFDHPLKNTKKYWKSLKTPKSSDILLSDCQQMDYVVRFVQIDMLGVAGSSPASPISRNCFAKHLALPAGGRQCRLKTPERW